MLPSLTHRVTELKSVPLGAIPTPSARCVTHSQVKANTPPVYPSVQSLHPKRTDSWSPLVASVRSRGVVFRCSGRFSRSLEYEGIVVLVAEWRPCSEGLEHSATVAVSAIVRECSDVVPYVPPGTGARLCDGGSALGLWVCHQAQFDPRSSLWGARAASHHSRCGLQSASGLNSDDPARDWRF